MIWIHTYYTGKFNSVMHKRVYDNYEAVRAQHAVLGGEINAYREAYDSVECWSVERMRYLLESEVSELIDNMTCHAPGRPWGEPGSPEWDIAKVDAMNKISEIIDEVYE